MEHNRFLLKIGFSGQKPWRGVPARTSLHGVHLAMNKTDDDFDQIFRPVERGGIFLLSTFGNEPISLMALAPTSLI